MSVSGEFFGRHRDEILALVRRCEESEKRSHPLERIMKTGEDTGHYNKEEMLLRVGWRR